MKKLYAIFERNISFDEVDINQYNKFEKISTRINYYKYIFAIILCLLILLQMMIPSIPWKEFGEESKLLSVIVATIAYFLNVLLAYSLHKKAYYIISGGGKIFFVKNPFKQKILQFLFFLFSPDYYFAREYKENIKKSYIRCCYKTCYSHQCLKDKNGEGICLKNWDGIRIDLKYFVIYSNWYNVILASLVAIITIFFWGYSGWLIDVLFYFLVFRILSRFIEIVVAFYKDVARVDDKLFATNMGTNHRYIHNWKNSLLLKSSRISLAVHSLAEIVILFSLLYYFISLNYLYLDKENLLIDIGTSGELNTFNFFLLSLSVSAFNFSFSSYNSILWSLAHVVQVILSIVLIILALATYLGSGNDLLKRDKEFYLKITAHRLKEEKNRLK